MAKKYNIKTTNKTKYERSTLSNSSAGPQPIDRMKIEEVNAVESIGLYDDFSFLKIDLNLYGKKDGAYGIPFKKAVHITEDAPRIRDHQKQAAQLFLSDLRGFGLLADCVGSGKTYEACVVISELAVRGRIDNLLIIVPDPALLSKWKHVIEMEFGFGKGKLKEINSLDVLKGAPMNEEGIRKPEGGYIMTYKAFSQSGKEMISSALFDLIVVDEAHNLCGGEKEDQTSMYYLSMMMQTKQKCDKPFCLLLTATPHSGNLTHMFNLWYFIRCKGGIPECFRENGNPEGAEREEYEKEKAYYQDVVCKGATTVAEYVAKAECDFLVGLRDNKSAIRDRFFEAFKTIVHKNDGTRYEVSYEAIDYDGYLALKECQKKSRAQAFLSMPENRDVRDMALDAVNQSYTNIVMRSIMVRRRNDLQVKRNAYSYFFLPIDKKVKITGQRDGKNPIPTFMIDDVSYSAESIKDIFANEELEKSLFENNPHFLHNGGAGKRGFSAYYSKVFDNVEEREQKSDYLRVLQTVCTLENEDEAIFIAKCERFVSLMRDIRSRKGNHRVIVFFDYKKEENSLLDDSGSTWRKLGEYLKKNAPELAKDVIDGGADKIDDYIAAYGKSNDAILFAECTKFTEGQDLQNGNIVINFEVPVDPLTVDQRIGRVYRLGQEDEVEIHSFSTMSRLDGYCLGYFAAIGILSDTEGDATILSGCNSDNMKVLRCPSCNDVSLIYESDYEETLPECQDCADAGYEGIKMEPRVVIDSHGVRKEYYICKKNEQHRYEIPTDDPLRCNSCAQAPIREPIVINEFVCANNSTHRIKRAKDKGYNYVCMSYRRNKMLRTQDDRGNILVGCSKFCAFKNCPYVDPDCALRREIEEISTEEEARQICASCRKFDKCACRIDNGDRPGDRPVMKSCNTCTLYSRGGKRFPCMQPYTINFGKDYQSGACPICNGELKQVQANTFETFIIGRFEHDHSFAHNFLREMNNTLDIKKILRFNDNSRM